MRFRPAMIAAVCLAAVPAQAPASDLTANSAGPVVRVSENARSQQANDHSIAPVWSPDGGRIAFVSSARNLVRRDLNRTQDIFVASLSNGRLSRISTAADGAEANGTSKGMTAPSWSPDGTQIAFSSKATNLVPDDTNGVRDIFVKTLGVGAIRRVNLTVAGGQANGSSDEATWSPDGTRIAFSSDADNLVPADTNESRDIFVVDLGSGELTRVSTDGSGAQAAESTYESSEPAWSPDGTRIAFSSDADNLVPDDTNGKNDIFVKSLVDGQVTRVSTTSSGAQIDAHCLSPQWSPDGRWITFTSKSSISSRRSQVFAKDLDAGTVTLVSAAPDGTEGKGRSGAGRFSPDGRWVLFSSTARNLVAGDRNRAEDVFITEVRTGRTLLVSTDRKGRPANSDSYPAGWSPDGRRILLESYATNLVRRDTNSSSDVFVKGVRGLR